MFRPMPIDTSDVRLPPEIISLAEILAENTHDVWSLNRMNQGWRCGVCRNEERKETPCLIAYGKLPEAEKEYDRKTSLETLKLIYKLGFSITENKLLLMSKENLPKENS